MLEKIDEKLEKLELFDEDFGLSINGKLQKISTQLGVADYSDGHIKVARNNREYFIYIYHGVYGYRVGAPPYFEIKTKLSFSPPFFGIRKSNYLDWVVENIISIPDFQVGDDKFDAQFYIKVSEIGWEWGNKLFSMDIIRQGISNLLLQGFDLIHSEDGYLKLVKYGDSYPKIETINEAIEHIHQIVSNIPEDYNPPTTYRLRGYNYWKPLLHLIALLFVLGAVVYWYIYKFILHTAPNP